MITLNERTLILELQGLRVSLAAKARVQKEMHPHEKNCIYTAVEALQELEDYYMKKASEKGGKE